MKPMQGGGARGLVSASVSALASTRATRAIVVHSEYRSTMASDWTDAIVATLTGRRRFNVYARKCGHRSEVARHQTWTTLHSVKDITGIQDALEAVARCAELLDLMDTKADWRTKLEALRSGQNRSAVNQ